MVWPRAAERLARKLVVALLLVLLARTLEVRSLILEDDALAIVSGVVGGDNRSATRCARGIVGTRMLTRTRTLAACTVSCTSDALTAAKVRRLASEERKRCCACVSKADTLANSVILIRTTFPRARPGCSGGNGGGGDRGSGRCIDGGSGEGDGTGEAGVNEGGSSDGGGVRAGVEGEGNGDGFWGSGALGGGIRGGGETGSGDVGSGEAGGGLGGESGGVCGGGSGGGGSDEDGGGGIGGSSGGIGGRFGGP
jgi:hypothetical protein